jgi:hypothetical protein
MLDAETEEVLSDEPTQVEAFEAAYLDNLRTDGNVIALHTKRA